METISFARATLPPECLPDEELADCAGTVLEREGKTLLSYGSGAGYTPLRELIGEWFGVHPFRVLLTNGSLQGLALLAQRLARGNSVVVEYPTYDRAQKLLLLSGASLLTATLDDEGVNVDDLEVQVRTQQSVAFVYLMPTFQNPTGRTLPAARRQQLVQVLGRRQIRIVEDDPYSLLRFEGEAEASLFDYTGQQSIYCSSFSETIAPGLRVGWLILPQELATELTEAANSTYITPALLSQAVVHEFIRRGRFEPNLQKTRDLLRTRRDAMLAALEKHFGGARWTRPEGGYFVWLELPWDTDMGAVLERAEGVTAVPGAEFSASSSMLRLSYSCTAPDEIEAGVERLAAAM